MPGKYGWVLLLAIGILAVRWWYFSPAVDAHDPAPTFSATTVAGRAFTLSQLRGRYVLLDFWGSWCGPCRRELPALRDFQEFSDRATLVSIAIEQDSSRWRAALQRDRRDWPLQFMDRTSNLRFLEGRIADLYGVNRLPMHFLIDPRGRIVAADTDPSAAIRYLREHAR